MNRIHNFSFFCILFLSLLAVSCSKIPEAPLSPSVKIATSKDNKDNVTINFSAGIRNENDSRAFTDIDGIFLIINDSGGYVLEIPFKKDVILPFETAVIQQSIELTPESAAPLYELLSIDPEKVRTGEDPGSRFIDSKNISFKKLEIQTIDIIDLLRSRINR